MSDSLADRDVNLRKMVVVRKKEEKKFFVTLLSTLGWVLGQEVSQGGKEMLSSTLFVDTGFKAPHYSYKSSYRPQFYG